MKFTKFGKAVLISAIAAVVALSITSCDESYTVGYLYVTGTVTNQSNGNGILSGYQIDHNTGRLVVINGLPVSSGGANPVRAVLITGSRFLYVLNRGTNSSGGSTCTTADPCQNANITECAVGGDGILSAQQTFFTQGITPFGLLGDPTGNFLFVLDHDAPDSNAITGSAATTNSCTEALGAPTTSCGDVTAFTVNQTTGRLSLIVNAQVSSASGAALPYFPVSANPIDFALTSGFIITLAGTPATGDTAFPYTYSTTTGQLTINQNSTQPLGISQGTAIVPGSGFLYVLDNEGTLVNNGSTSPILPFSIGINGALPGQTGGA